MRNITVGLKAKTVRKFGKIFRHTEIILINLIHSQKPLKLLTSPPIGRKRSISTLRFFSILISQTATKQLWALKLTNVKRYFDV